MNASCFKTLVLVGGLAASFSAMAQGTLRDGRANALCLYSHTLADDPIVHPQRPGTAMRHDFFGNTAANAKQAYPEPLLTSLDSDLARAQQASAQEERPGFSSPDGYYVSYMHPPGSLLGAGVTVGMQF